MAEHLFQFIVRWRRLIIWRHIAEIKDIEDLLPIQGYIAISDRKAERVQTRFALLLFWSMALDTVALDKAIEDFWIQLNRR